MEWFPNQVADGSIVYHDCKEAFPAISFERLLPESEAAGKFKLDETDVDSMIKCMENESVREVTLKGESTQYQASGISRKLQKRLVNLSLQVIPFLSFGRFKMQLIMYYKTLENIMNN